MFASFLLQLVTATTLRFRDGLNMAGLMMGRMKNWWRMKEIIRNKKRRRVI